MALPLGYEGLTVDRLLDQLGWSHDRLHTAVTASQELLAGGSLRPAVISLA
jgi:hypothetical protein